MHPALPAAYRPWLLHESGRSQQFCSSIFACTQSWWKAVLVRCGIRVSKFAIDNGWSTLSFFSYLQWTDEIAVFTHSFSIFILISPIIHAKYHTAVCCNCLRLSCCARNALFSYYFAEDGDFVTKVNAMWHDIAVLSGGISMKFGISSHNQRMSGRLLKRLSRSKVSEYNSIIVK